MSPVRASLRTNGREPFTTLVAFLARFIRSSTRPLDHFLPLLYVVAQAEPDERLAFPVDGFDGGSVSMLGALIG